MLLNQIIIHMLNIYEIYVIESNKNTYPLVNICLYILLFCEKFSIVIYYL